MEVTKVHHVRRYVYHYIHHNHLGDIIDDVYVRSLSRAQERARIFFNDNKKGVTRKERLSGDYWAIWSFDDLIEVRKHKIH